MTVTWTPQNGGTCEVVNGEWETKGEGTVTGAWRERECVLTVIAAEGYWIKSIAQTKTVNGVPTTTTSYPTLGHITTSRLEKEDVQDDGFYTWDTVYYSFYVEFESLVPTETEIQLTPYLYAKKTALAGKFTGDILSGLDKFSVANATSNTLNVERNGDRIDLTTVAELGQNSLHIYAPAIIQCYNTSLSPKPFYAKILRLQEFGPPNSIDNGIAFFDVGIVPPGDFSRQIIYTCNLNSTGLIVRSPYSGIILRGASGIILRDD